MLSVNTLGKFQVINEEDVLNDDNIRSAMMTKLLLYILIHRDQTLGTDEIASALWQEEEVENPAGALKNLMYRLRTLLKQHFGEGDFILTNRGSYYWNPDIKVVIDAEEFEKLVEKARACKQKPSQAIASS